MEIGVTVTVTVTAWRLAVGGWRCRVRGTQGVIFNLMDIYLKFVCRKVFTSLMDYGRTRKSMNA